MSTQGVEWHMKNVHGTTRHSDAYDAASAAQRALVMWRPNPVAPPGFHGNDICGRVTKDPIDPSSVQLVNEQPPQPPAAAQVDSVGGSAPLRRLVACDMASAQSNPGNAECIRKSF